VPLRSVSDRRDLNILLTLEAWIAAGAGDRAKAQTIIEPVLAFERGLFERKDNEDVTQYIEYAQALYGAALADPRAAKASLSQAARLLDALPAPLRTLKSIERLRAAIADAGHAAVADARRVTAAGALRATAVRSALLAARFAELASPTR
jgi:hypothetical protein